jgi:hypothetical protein
MPREKAYRLVIDTNLWISMLINKDFFYMDKLLDKKEAVLIFSEELLDEFLEVVTRPKFKKYFSKADINLILKFIEQNAEFVNVSSAVSVCRDAKDNFLLSLALDGQADFILSGDKDLLDLIKYESTEILTIKEFSERK